MQHFVRLPQGVTDLHARYRRCAQCKTQVEADLLLNELAHDFARREQCSVELARAVERSNIGYWASSYLDRDKDMLRVWSLFGTESPIFKRKIPHWRQAFAMGVWVATQRKGIEMLPEERAEIMYHIGDLVGAVGKGGDLPE